MTNILVIKLGALGDFIQALGPMQAIRRHHPQAHITLLTTKPFVEFATRSNLFDAVWVDKRPRWGDLPGWYRLRKKLIGGNFTRVYDLQNNDRTELYLRLFPKRATPEWVGAARGASHRNVSPERTAGDAFAGHVQTLGLAGIKNVTLDDLSWIDGDVSRFALPDPFIILVPGSAPKRVEKRWPASHYGALAQGLVARGLHTVIVGSESERDVAQAIQQQCPTALNLTGKTDLYDIALLARYAAASVGNDTGPMHLIAASGCPTLVLFSRHSNPLRHAPRGARMKFLQADDLVDLPPETVMKDLLENAGDLRTSGA